MLNLFVKINDRDVIVNCSKLRDSIGIYFNVPISKWIIFVICVVHTHLLGPEY